MRKRVLTVMKPIAVLMAVGFIYLIVYNVLGYGIPCPIHAVLHIYCGGCGVTRMLVHLSRFEFAEALSSNCVLFFMLPAALVLYVRHTVRFIRSGRRGLSKAESVLTWTAVAVLLIFTVVRNVFPIDILVP